MSSQSTRQKPSWTTQGMSETLTYRSEILNPLIAELTFKIYDIDEFNIQII